MLVPRFAETLARNVELLTSLSPTPLHAASCGVPLVSRPGSQRLTGLGDPVTRSCEAIFCPIHHPRTTVSI